MIWLLAVVLVFRWELRDRDPMRGERVCCQCWTNHGWLRAADLTHSVQHLGARTLTRVLKVQRRFGWALAKIGQAYVSYLRKEWKR